jgi:hypothetical protein
MKDFLTQLNDLIAPVTRAYSEPEIQTVTLKPSSISDDGTSATVTITVKLKRTAEFSKATGPK